VRLGAADVLVVVGVGACAAGLWMLSPPLCLVFSGLASIGAGLATARLERSRRGEDG